MGKKGVGGAFGGGCQWQVFGSGYEEASIGRWWSSWGSKVTVMSVEHGRGYSLYCWSANILFSPGSL